MSMKLTRGIFLAATLLSLPALGADKLTVIERPDISQTNRFYVSNRQPLEPSRFIALPIGVVKPKGWLLECLKRQRDGLSGNLGEISAWLQKEDNAWLSSTGKGRYGWEELPYWLKGYMQLGYLLDDAKVLAESRTWIEGALHSQRADGDFGPDQKFDDDGSRDFWANMLMLFCLQTDYEQSHDPRVLDLMTKYFHFQLTVPDAQFLTHYWQKMRGGDNLYSVYWLYNLTGDRQLLTLAEKIHRCTANWELKNDLPNWHNVNIAQCFREPATHYLQTHNPAELQATYANFHEVRKRYGQVPGGMFGSDENCRPGYTDPHQAVETCGMVEQMLSDELLMQMSGDPFWGDQCETVAFNSYPAALLPDFRALRYLTAPNMVVSDAKNHAPGLQNGGPFLLMNPFSSRCCQHNHAMGWPYFTKHLWLATPDNGLCAALYSASEVAAQVADGARVRIVEETRYPFEQSVRFTVHTEKPAAFPLYLRIPAWCRVASVLVNGQRVDARIEAGKFVRLEREFKNQDTVVLELPMQISLQRWAANHDSVSVNYGPLTFSLKIGERYERRDSSKTAIGDSAWQRNADPSKWPSFEIHPTTPWNYGLILAAANPEKGFEVQQLAWPRDDYPFTPESYPLQVITSARKIPQWTLDKHGLCAKLQDSPVASSEPRETITLIPMGAARLRISAFPTVGEGSAAHPWQAPAAKAGSPAYKASASHCHSSDTVDALCDGVEPQSSNDQEIPRFTWWDHRGSAEWVQYDFGAPREVSSVEVYWFDDTGDGRCRVPASWKLLYRSNGTWVPVEATSAFTTNKDAWNRVTFPAIETIALRLEVELQPGFSGGILEWAVR
jgi:hypothetical protein